MLELNLIQKLAIWALPVLFAITLHEVAHGWMALKFGDRTAQMMGRLSWNPIKHIDPIGTLLVPGLVLAFGGFLFGWAKPVPVSYQNLKNPKRDMAWVALAGPLANLIMAVFWMLMAKLGFAMMQNGEALAEPMVLMGVAGVYINIILAVLNLLPLPPLDGGRVLMAVLPNKLSWQLSQIEPYGFFILLGLMLLHVLGAIMNPPVIYLLNLLIQIFNFPQAFLFINALLAS